MNADVPSPVRDLGSAQTVRALARPAALHQLVPHLLRAVRLLRQLHDCVQGEEDVGGGEGGLVRQVRVQDAEGRLVGHDEDGRRLPHELDDDGLQAVDDVLVRLAPGVAVGELVGGGGWGGGRGRGG